MSVSVYIVLFSGDLEWQIDVVTDIRIQRGDTMLTVKEMKVV